MGAVRQIRGRNTCSHSADSNQEQGIRAGHAGPRALREAQQMRTVRCGTHLCLRTLVVCARATAIRKVVASWVGDAAASVGERHMSCRLFNLSNVLSHQVQVCKTCFAQQDHQLIFSVNLVPETVHPVARFVCVSLVPLWSRGLLCGAF